MAVVNTVYIFVVLNGFIAEVLVKLLCKRCLLTALHIFSF